MKKDERIAHFMNKVFKDASGCWLWRGAIIKSTGYGRFALGGCLVEYAHRASWILFKGDIPCKMYVCHKCDVPSCVNPEHLFIGTAKDNMQDASKKGRCVIPTLAQRLRGEDQPMSKISNVQVAEIRVSPETGVALSKRYGISQCAISMIRNFKTYRCVP